MSRDDAVMVIGLLPFGLLIATVVVVGIWRMKKFGRPGEVPPPDPVHARRFVALRDEDYDLVVRCGAWVNGLHATRPFVSLLVTRDQAELRCPRVDPIRIVRAEVTGLRRGGRFGRRSIKFETTSGRLDRLVFWLPGEAAERLAELGWF